MESTSLRTEKAVVFTDNLKPEVYINDTKIDVPEVNSKESIELLLRNVHRMNACYGVSDEGTKHREWAQGCSGHIPVLIRFKTGRCHACQIARRRNKKREGQKSVVEKYNQMKLKVKGHARKAKQLTNQMKRLQGTVRDTMKAVHKLKAQRVDEIINLLPEEQQTMVRACFECAKHHNKKTRRYTTDWVYECILMRMKAPGLYEKLRKENKISLPSKQTLLRYMANLRPSYGFQANVFELMKMKASNMRPSDRHGCIQLDEMALDSKTYYDSNSLSVQGLVDLPSLFIASEERERKENEPDIAESGQTNKGDQGDKNKTKRGDHALVILFQPFRGRWVQAIGAFLSAGAVKSDVLHKLILEATALLEKNGFFVDCVVTDGATWNRSMWDLFGVDIENSECPHPIDPERKLRFASDFPHLVKNIWTRILEKQVLNMPEGAIKLDHWKAVLDIEEKKGIKGNFTLKRDHLKPTNYQKMKVKLAMQFFGERVAHAMRHYQEQGEERLKDASPTIEFIERMNALVDAMNGQLPWEGLLPDPASKNHKVLLEFLDYLYAMNDISKSKFDAIGKKTRRKRGRPHVGFPDEITTASFLGLVVTVKTALSLIRYLADECDFKYLLTRRMNQDSLEHLFGHIRGACGANNHPDPLMFINTYRLLMTYSLIKPPRGSNVSGAEMMEALLDLKDFKADANAEQRAQLVAKIDELLDRDLNLPELDDMDSHDLQSTSVDRHALTVFGGYISRKVRKFAPANKCVTCSEALCMAEESEWEEREALLRIRTHGGLLRPSNPLYDLLLKLEQCVVDVTSKCAMHAGLLFTILDHVLSSSQSGIQLVGCTEHARGLTTAIITHYLNCRMHFICAESDRAIAKERRRKRDLAKRARLN